MRTFSYIKYDEESVTLQEEFKKMFEDLEVTVSTLKPGRARSLVSTKLEEAYMWVGKSIRDSQIERTGTLDHRPGRGE